MPAFIRKGSQLLALGLLLTGAAQSPLTYAQCAPDPIGDGGTVSCVGTDPDGFVSASDAITVNVTGAVNTAIATFHALDLSGVGVNVQMTGSSAITPAVGGAGIRLRADDAIVSVGSGASITVDDNAAGIVLEANNAQITIDGAIVGSNHFGHGVLTLGTDNNQVTVGQTGSVITTGTDARGIDLQSSNAAITVAGTVTTSGGQLTGDAAHALIVGDGNLNTTGGVINLLATARVTTSGEGAGAVLAGGDGTTVNIAAGAIVTTNGEQGSINGIPSFGVGANGENTTVHNSGTINANPATGSVAALIGGNDSVFNHNASAVMTGGGFFPGIQIAFAFIGEGGASEILNNRGTITGSVISFDDANAVVNNIGGTISENVFLGLGDDRVNAQSSIGGDVSLDEGSDELLMVMASIVGGALDGGDDTGVGDGFIDVLSIQGGARTVPDNTLENWEIIRLTNTTLTLDTGALNVGGDPGTDPGTGLNYGITLEGSSALDLTQSLALAGNVTNGASVRLTTDGSADTNLQLTGDYIGNSGQIVLDAVLSDDSSPADRLTVSGGSIIGTSRLAIRDLGGLGGTTLGDGILLVETTGGASSNPDAFELSGTVIVGGFEYALFFGGLNNPDDGNWYLRSANTAAVPALSNALLGIAAMLLALIGVGSLRRRQTVRV